MHTTKLVGSSVPLRKSAVLLPLPLSSKPPMLLKEEAEPDFCIASIGADSDAGALSTSSSTPSSH